MDFLRGRGRIDLFEGDLARDYVAVEAVVAVFTDAWKAAALQGSSTLARLRPSATATWRRWRWTPLGAVASGSRVLGSRSFRCRRSCDSRDAAGSSAITAIDHICGKATAPGDHADYAYGRPQSSGALTALVADAPDISWQFARTHGVCRQPRCARLTSYFRTLQPCVRRNDGNVQALAPERDPHLC